MFLAAALAAGAAPAAAATVDQTSTRRFVTAALGYATSVIGSEGRSRAAADALVAHVTSTCPATLSSVPSNGTAAQQATGHTFVEAALLEVILAELAPDAAAGVRYGQRLKQLRWTSRTLRREVATFADEGLLAVSLSPPDLCREAAAAAPTGFATVPRDTARFLREAAPAFAESASAFDLLKLMKPYVAPGEASAVALLRRRQIKLDRFFTVLTADATERELRALFGPAGPTLF